MWIRSTSNGPWYNLRAAESVDVKANPGGGYGVHVNYSDGTSVLLGGLYSIESDAWSAAQKFLSSTVQALDVLP